MVLRVCGLGGGRLGLGRLGRAGRARRSAPAESGRGAQEARAELRLGSVLVRG